MQRHAHELLGDILFDAGPLTDTGARATGGEAPTSVSRVDVERSARLEDAGLLAAGVAHDVNNLLTGILANAGLALERLPDDHGVHALIAQIRAAGVRAAELTRHFLDHSGPGGRTVQAVDLSELAAETVGLLRPTFPSDAAVVFRLDYAAPRIAGDPMAIRQVVMNLVTNAAAALEDGRGTISVATSRRVVTDDRSATTGTTAGGALRDADGAPIPAGDYVTLAVRDTGRGMDDATRRRIFEPFFTTRSEGRGLGLSATRDVVREHGGYLCLDTAPGAGSAFEVLFPTPEFPVEFTDEPAAAPLDGPADGTVLVADDELAVRLVARRALERRGYTVIVAADGDEALEQLEEHGDELAAVFLDLSMPGRDGPAVLRELERIRPDLPVVLTSGFDEDEAREEFARVAGAEAAARASFVRKPFEPVELVSAIRRVSGTASAGGAR